jgi:cell division protein FtsZ
MTFDPETSNPPGAKIKVIGVGGGGGNAVNTMIRSGLDGVDFITCNTDVQALRYSLATHKIQIGKELTRGLGAGADPDIGRDAALEDKTEIQNILREADMVFITAGMGGGTGTGGAAVIAQLAREMGALTVAVVTKPFIFEGKRRKKQAEAGIARLRESVDTLITIPNQRLLQVASPDLSMIDAFKMADEVLVNAVRGISDIINIHGVLNVDFADVKTVMSCMGQALMGIGSGRGDKRAVEAALMAISSPLLEEIDIEGATGILINITGGSRITMHEIDEACGVIQEAAHEDANIIFGAVIDETLGDELRVTVIATGFPVDKAEGDSDPNRGKSFSSSVASRLASAAGKPSIQQTSVEKAPQGKAPEPEPSVEIEDIPQSPYDDLAFAKKSEDPEPSKSITSQVLQTVTIVPAIEVPKSLDDAPAMDAPQVEPPLNARGTTQDVIIPVQPESLSASNFAKNSAEEAQELARWTLDFSSSEALGLTEEIPSLAGPEEAQPLFDGHSQKPIFEEKISLAAPVDLASAQIVPVAEIELATTQSTPTQPSASSVADMSQVDSFAIEQSSAPESSHQMHHDEIPEISIDPKDEFASTVVETMGSSTLADTLFDSQLSDSIDERIDSILNLQEDDRVTPSDTSTRASDDFVPRQGATKEEPAFPSLPLHETELDLTEIDRKIDEALSLAERMRANRHHDDQDDLDVPSFLRANMKDLPLD